MSVMGSPNLKDDNNCMNNAIKYLLKSMRWRNRSKIVPHKDTKRTTDSEEDYETYDETTNCKVKGSIEKWLEDSIKILKISNHAKHFADKKKKILARQLQHSLTSHYSKIKFYNQHFIHIWTLLSMFGFWVSYFHLCLLSIIF